MVGFGARAAYSKLKRLEAKRVLNGGPRYTMDGYADAVGQGSGELVTISIPLFNQVEAGSLESLSRTGIITNLASGVQGSFNNARVDFVFYVCDRLHVRSSGLVTTYTRVGA